MTHLSSFIQFHRANPKVWELFQAFTRQAIGAGRDHYSADAILHRIRWHTTVETTGPVFKINDHYSSLYARLFHMAHPQHGRFFEIRALSDERDVDRDLRALLNP